MKCEIAVLPGDGIGPEITDQAVKVTEAIARKFGHVMRYTSGLIGVAAIEQTGEPYPEETHRKCLGADAVLFGAVGDPRYDNNPKASVRPEQGLLAMRKMLGLYANIRPLKLFPPLMHMSPLKPELLKGVDFIFIRELTGGIYFGQPRGRSDDGNAAYDTNMYTRDEIERILEIGFDFARGRRKKLTLVDKANVLETSRLWRETAQAMAPRHPDIRMDYMFVDNAAMQIMLNPGQFDVIVTENMFGDILSDEASVISGSLGLLPSASIGLHTSVFEPIHGSYPQAAGKNIANPLAMILSAAMMFEYALRLPEEAAMIRASVEASLEQGIVTRDIAGGKAYLTSEVGNWIADHITNPAR